VQIMNLIITTFYPVFCYFLLLRPKYVSEHHTLKHQVLHPHKTDRQNYKPCVTFHNMLDYLRWGVVGLSPNPEAEEPPLFDCPRLLIQYIRSCPPYLEADSSIRNLKTGHVVVKGTILVLL
jgi:hypothetical protein